MWSLIPIEGAYQNSPHRWPLFVQDDEDVGAKPKIMLEGSMHPSSAMNGATNRTTNGTTNGTTNRTTNSTRNSTIQGIEQIEIISSTQWKDASGRTFHQVHPDKTLVPRLVREGNTLYIELHVTPRNHVLDQNVSASTRE